MADGWYTAAELAALRLPGLPTTKAGVIGKAQRGGWERQQRQQSGGGWLYPVSALPNEAQKALARKALRIASSELHGQLDLPLLQVADLKDFQRRPMEARAALLGHIDHLEIGRASCRERVCQYV